MVDFVKVSNWCQKYCFCNVCFVCLMNSINKFEGFEGLFCYFDFVEIIVLLNFGQLISVPAQFYKIPHQNNLIKSDRKFIQSIVNLIGSLTFQQYLYFFLLIKQWRESKLCLGFLRNGRIVFEIRSTII